MRVLVAAGKLVRKQLAFPERAIVTALRVPDGDFRDWPEPPAGRPASPPHCAPPQTRQTGHDPHAG